MRIRRLFAIEITVVAAVLVVGGLVGLTSGSDDRRYKVLDDLEPLRADFNAHSEEVRAVLLASPT